MGVTNLAQPAASSIVVSIDSPRQSRTVQHWLAWLGPMLAGVGWLAVVDTADSRSVVSGKWPATERLPPGVGLLAARAAGNQKPAQAKLVESAQPHVLSIPLANSSFESPVRKQLVLLVGSKQFDAVQQQTLIQMCRWASTWLDDPAGQQQAGRQRRDQQPVHLVTAMLDAMVRHRSVNAVAFAVVNAAVTELGCKRVSLGLVEQDRINVIAVSGQSHIDARRDVIRQLADAMYETVSYQGSLQYPSPRKDVQLVAHAGLFVNQGQHASLSVRLPCDGKDKAVVLLERAHCKKFNTADVATIENMLAPLASVLTLLQEANATPKQRLKQKVRKAAWRLRERDIAPAKAGVFIVFMLIFLAAFLPVPHRVTARAVIEAADRQVVVAPQAGYVQSSHVRAGDHVTAGQLLASLDSRALALEADKWRSERMKHEQKYATALAVHDRAELSRLRAEAVRIDAELALVQQQLERSELRAPFAGVLLSGDLSQSLGAPVQAGDVLFELASAKQFRLLLDVDERDAGFIASGQTAELRMASLPEKTWQAELEDVLPVAIVEQGSSVFRLPARLQQDASVLRPGMQGIARIHVGSRSLLWVYTHSLLDRLRLLAWQLGLLA